MSNNKEKLNRRINVGKTKVAKNPWEEERYVYNISESNGSIWSDNIWVFLIQIIVGIVTFIYVFNNC